MSTRVYSICDTLPERVTAFAKFGAQDDFFRSLDWLRIASTTAAPAGDKAHLYVAERGNRPVAALVASERHAAGTLRARILLGAGQGIYSATYGPLLDPEHGAAGLREIAAGLAKTSPPYDLLRFAGLDPAAPDCATLIAAFRASGMIVQRYANFQSWSEEVRDVTLHQYIARRPAHIRTIAERGWLAIPDAAASRLELLSGGAALTAPLIDYALVDLQSPKPPEAYPDCVPETVRAAARHGVLRLGLLYIDDRPLAAQIWIVGGGKATQWRQRHVAGDGALSTRTVLTLAMLRWFFESGRIARIEFGRDGSDVASDWANRCDERIGMIVFNPQTPKGLLAAARHIGGHWARMAAWRAHLAASAVRFRE